MKKCCVCKLSEPIVRFAPSIKYTCAKCAAQRLNKYRAIRGSRAWANVRCSNLKRKADRLGIPFDLNINTVLELYSNSNCGYCGRKTNKITMDRKNPADGYCKNNIFPSCLKCNMVKSNLITHEQMLLIGTILAST